jgi:MarR family transcriptional regulator, lower aerobic nicotinate degradation pathway regulator
MTANYARAMRQESAGAPPTADRRRNVITVTAAGVARAAALGRQVGNIREELLKPLNSQERQQLTEILRKLLAHHRQGVSPLSKM